MFLFVVGCFDFVIVVMIYGIEYRLFYNRLYCLWFVDVCCFVVVCCYDLCYCFL